MALVGEEARGPFVIDEGEDSGDETSLINGGPAHRASPSHGATENGHAQSNGDPNGLNNGRRWGEIPLNSNAVRYTALAGDGGLRSCEADILIDGPGAQADGVEDTRRWPWWRHPKLRENRKAVAGSLCLTVVGLSLVIYSLGGVVSGSGVSSWVFLLAGLLCLVPGLYHVVFIACALRGRPGFDFQTLPTFN